MRSFCVGCPQVFPRGRGVQSDPEALVQVISNHIGQGSGVADGLVDDIGGLVHGIVIDLQQEAGAVDVLEIQGVFRFGVRRNVLNCANPHQVIGAAAVKQNHAGHILVVLGGYGQGLAGMVDDHRVAANQFRGSVVDDHGDRQRSTLTQCIPIDEAFAVLVVFGGQRPDRGEIVSLVSRGR